MNRRKLLIRNSVVALGIMAAFVFSAAQATAYTDCTECQEYPSTPCEGYPNPDAFCQDFCHDYFCEDGFCKSLPENSSECLCLE